MSTIAEPSPTVATNERPDITWRDALTPMGRAGRRRWTTCYALLLILLAGSVVDDAFSVGPGDGEGIPLILLVAIPIVFGMLRRGTRSIAALDHPDLDERDIAARNGAYRVAFPLLVVVVLAALVMLAVALPEGAHTTRLGARETATTLGWFLQSDALIGLGLWIALWAIFLPTGVLAWREPDALEPELGAARMPEPIRDALLGLTLTAAIVISLVTNSNAGALLFVAAVALLGGIARRTAGQPAMSRQRIWRVVIGILLIVLVLAIGLAASSGGGGVMVAEGIGLHRLR